MIKEKNMRLILGFLISVGLVVAQPQPTVSPSVVNVTFDLAKDSLVSLPDVTISNPTGTAFVYNTVVNTNQSNVLIWPVQSVIPPGTNQVVRMSVAASNLPVGNYNIPVTFVQVPNTGNISFSVGINLAVIDSRTFTASTDPTIPHIASGEGWTTTVKLANTSNWISLVTLKFYDPLGVNAPFFVNGNYVTEHSVVVPGNGVVDVVMSDPISLKTGSLDIKTVYGTGVSVSATYSNTIFEATIPSSIPNRDSFTMIFDNVGSKSTGLALVNYLNYQQEIVFVFYDKMGIQFYTDKIVLAAKGQAALTLDVAFPNTKGKSGTVKIQTTRPSLSAFGLKFNLEKNYFTTIPIF